MEKTYLISDAAKQVQVETHVLRYWEEELGLKYYGPINGHDYKELITYLELAKNVTKPEENTHYPDAIRTSGAMRAFYDNCGYHIIC